MKVKKMKKFKISPNTKTILIEDFIEPSVHIEYIKYSDKYIKDLDEQKVISQVEDLFDPNITLEQKKILLVQLSKIDNVNIFRKLEQYHKNPDPDLRTWATLAYKESQNLIQSSILNEHTVLVSSALGGKNTKMRFFIILKNYKKQQFTTEQINIIEKETHYIFEKNNAEIEKIQFGSNFYTIVALFEFDLVNMKKQIDSIINELISEISIYGIKLHDKYIVTNTKIFTLEQTKDLLNNLEEQIKNKKIEDDLNSYLSDNSVNSIDNSDDDDFFFNSDDDDADNSDDDE